MKRMVEVARQAGVPVSAHATSKEGMRQAELAGVATIEHGYEGHVEVFPLMATPNAAPCPTLAANEAMGTYRGRMPGRGAEPIRACTTQSVLIERRREWPKPTAPTAHPRPHRPAQGRRH